MDNWCQHIPALHRVVADPSQVNQLPAVTRDLSLEQACATWEPLHYLFTALLGLGIAGAWAGLVV